jgi:molybdopterin-guanine dinucleotide biosynthesis protein B
LADDETGRRVYNSAPHRGGKGSPSPFPVDASLSMRMIRLVGRSGSGKTTLIAALLPALVARGLTVSTIKHAHHGFDLDRPGKDSFRHREAGAKEVMLVDRT